MSKLFICAVRDSAVEAYARPFYVQRPAEAVRSFTMEVNRAGTSDSANMLNSHPDDYELWLLGTFDEVAGFFENTPERLARAKDLLRTDE